MSAPSPEELRQQLRHCVHALNNVLGQVLGFGSLLVRDIGKAHEAGYLPKAVQEFAEEVMAAGLRGEQVARQLTEIVKSLPPAEAVAGMQEEPTRPLTTAAPAGRKVLLVGVQPRAERMLVPAFRMARWDPNLHASSFDALRAFRAAPEDFAAVVTEQGVQEILGTELVAAVKALSPQTPCIILRPLDSSLDEMSARMAGADAAPRDDLPPAALLEIVGDLVSKAENSAAKIV